MSSQPPEPPVGDQYGWLYGDNPPSPSGGDATQESPAANPQYREEPESDVPPAQLPPPKLPPPGSSMPSSETPRPRRKKRWPKVIGLLVAAWLVFLIAVPIWAWSNVNKVNAEPKGARPGDQGGTTYLLVGSDSRAGLSQEQQDELSTGGDGGGRGRTDTIMLLHTGDGPTLLMSVPRDSLVDIPGYGTTKINAAFAFGGPKLLVETLEQNTGIRIDDYIEIGFGGLVNVVDGLGGVEICPKERIKDKDSGLNVKKGCQQADGKTALAYSRNRHSYATQDIQRVQAQREVIGSIGSEVRSPWTVLNPVRYWRVGTSGAESLRIGKNVGPISLAKFALALSGAMAGSGLNCTVPLRDFAVTWDPERAPAMFELIAKDRTSQIKSQGLCTEDGLPKS